MYATLTLILSLYTTHRMLEQVSESQQQQEEEEEEEDSFCHPLAFTVELRPQDTLEGGLVGFMVPTEQVYYR